MDNSKNIDQYNGHEFVEIAGIKWATCNVGAEKPTDFGLYFQWGDTQGYTAEQVGDDKGKKFFYCGDYKFDNGNTLPEGTNFTKYNADDGKTLLEPSDDAVQAAWGGAWRMPTTDEFQALASAVTSAWTSDYQGSGVAGLVLTDKTDSSTILFFPAAGVCYAGRVNFVGSNGWYSSSSYFTDYADVYIMHFCADWLIPDGNTLTVRIFGYSVRGVAD